MSDASGLIAELLKAQKSDGGWGYQSSLSWTEPTAFALLALSTAGLPGAAWDRGFRWLESQQREDGSWPPNAAAPLSNAVTSNALLALIGFAPRNSMEQGVNWLLAQIRPDLTLWQQAQFWLQNRPSAETVMGGSPWFPGTASWVSPTVMTVLSFSRAQAQGLRIDLRRHIVKAKEYLLSRRCKDGGWNHGGSQLYSEESTAYPEMTGMALLAFDASEHMAISRDLDLAESMLAHPQSGEGLSWLQLALAKHGRLSERREAGRFPCRTVREVSLRILAEHGMNPNNRLLVQTTC